MITQKNVTKLDIISVVSLSYLNNAIYIFNFNFFILTAITFIQDFFYDTCRHK